MDQVSDITPEEKLITLVQELEQLAIAELLEEEDLQKCDENEGNLLNLFD